MSTTKGFVKLDIAKFTPTYFKLEEIGASDLGTMLTVASDKLQNPIVSDAIIATEMEFRYLVALRPTTKRTDTFDYVAKTHRVPVLVCSQGFHWIGRIDYIKLYT